MDRRIAGPRDDELLRDKEQAILKLGELYRDKKCAPLPLDGLSSRARLTGVCPQERRCFGRGGEVVAATGGAPCEGEDGQTQCVRYPSLWMPSFLLTCRLAVRSLLDFFGDIPGSTQVQIDATKESAEWAKGEKRIFLKQNLETRLVALCVKSLNARQR